MKGIRVVFASTCLLVWLLAPSVAEASLDTAYTAQRKPRITVLRFDDTNADARSRLYGESVSAMLVTFLKRKSQFVVVERQKLEEVLQEWRRNQSGLTNITSGDPSSRELLEKLDGILIGSVTLLGEQIEIDAKLLSRQDGRIIAATQRSGPIGCLRQIVERLGTAIEQEFLRPYYGRLKITIPDPLNVRVFLTPILVDNALDEERPPIELGVSVRPEPGADVVRPWVTDPTTLVIENVLSGWYTLRLERSGYEGAGAENARFEFNSMLGEVVHKASALPVDQGGDEGMFLVEVRPLETSQLDELVELQLRKRAGSVSVEARRQFVDREPGQVPGMRVLVASRDLELDRASRAGLVEPGEECSRFVVEDPVILQRFPETKVRAGARFDFEAFKGGSLWIEDYRGEPLPAGRYVTLTWAPNHRIDKRSSVVVNDNDRGRRITAELRRSTAKLELLVSERQKGSVARLVCEETGFTTEVPLDFEERATVPDVPLDRCTLTHNVPGFGSWRQTIGLLPDEVPQPPTLEELSALLTPPSGDGKEVDPVDNPRAVPIPVKTQLWIGGREPVNGVPPGVHFDPMVGQILADLVRDLESENRGIQASQAKATQSLLVAAPRAGEPEQTPRRRRLALLEWRLALTDLLLLDATDIARLRRFPELAERLRAFVEAGGALAASVAEAGDYAAIFGAPLAVQPKFQKTDQVELFPGEVPEMALQLEGELSDDRQLPRFAHVKNRIAGWRVVAFAKKGKEPQIVERGELTSGGYAQVWAENLTAVGNLPEVTTVRQKLFDRALVWAQYLMFRRLDREGRQMAEARQKLGSRLGNVEPKSKGKNKG